MDLEFEEAVVSPALASAFDAPLRFSLKAAISIEVTGALRFKARFAEVSLSKQGQVVPYGLTSHRLLPNKGYVNYNAEPLITPIENLGKKGFQSNGK